MSEDNEGKYDDEARKLLIEHKANAALVIVIGGERGTGFSFSALYREMAGVIPGVLRAVADEIEKENAGGPS